MILICARLEDELDGSVGAAAILGFGVVSDDLEFLDREGRHNHLAHDTWPEGDRRQVSSVYGRFLIPWLATIQPSDEQSATGSLETGRHGQETCGVTLSACQGDRRIQDQVVVNRQLHLA